MYDLESICAVLAKWCSTETFVAELWLFGSYANGNADGESDIDLACLVAGTSGGSGEANWIFEADRMKSEIESLLPGIPVSLNRYAPDSMNRIVTSAVNEHGRLIYKKA